MRVRRVVTGHDESGTSVFVSERHPGEKPARIAVFICGASYSAVPPAG